MPGGWQGSSRRARLPDDWQRRRRRVLRRDAWTCYNCGGEASEVDHIVAGDDHDEANLAAICASCHRRKSAAEGVTARATMRARARRSPEPHPGVLRPRPREGWGGTPTGPDAHRSA